MLSQDYEYNEKLEKLIKDIEGIKGIKEKGSAKNGHASNKKRPC